MINDTLKALSSHDSVTIFAETNYRAKHVQFGIKASDRQYHMAIIGRTGMGKSTLMETLMLSDMHSGAGLALLDPHGDLAEAIIRQIAPDRSTDLIYFNPAEDSSRLGFNILESPGVKKHLIVSGVISVFKKIWADSWGPRMEHVFRHALASLVQVAGTTLGDVKRILQEKEYRAWILSQVHDESLLYFWSHEYATMTPSFLKEAISPILNKVGAFSVHPDLRSVVESKRNDFDLRQVMNQGKIFIANLSKGKLGEEGTVLLGSLLSTQFELAALGRASVPHEQRRPFYIYVDEFPILATASFTGMLSEARKYGIGLVLAAQYVEQLEEPIRNALFENVGTLILFRLGPESARYLAPQFAPTFSKEDLMNVGRYNIYLKLMIDGIPSKPFSATTLAPANLPLPL